jgi:hypothetical protein
VVSTRQMGEAIVAEFASLLTTIPS